MVLPTIASGDQPLPPDQGDLTPIAKAALVAGSIGASGFIPTSNGRLFDRYVNAIRTVETGFPAAILRTFRTSEFLSPLESWSQIDVSSSALQHGKYAEFLSSRFGHATSLSLKRTGSIFGQVTNEAGEILGYGLQIEAGSQKGTAIADYFARASGIQLTEFQSLNDALLRSQYRLANPGIPYAEWLESLEPQLRRQRLILGSRIRSKISILGKDLQLSKSFAAGLAKTETVFNLLRAKAASTTGRLNTLLSAPLDIPYLGGVLSKIPGLRSLSVRPGTSTQMISRFIGKGLLIGAGWKGLEYLDYLRNEGSPLAPVFSTAAGAGIGSLIARAPGMKFSKAGLLIGGAVGLLAGVAPRFDEGLFYGAATLATDLTLAKAEISEATGLTESLQEQERVTPGLTDLSTGAAFAGVGALAAGFFSYGGLLKESILNRKSASRFADVIEITRAARKENLLKGVWESRFGRAIEDIPFLKRITKTKSPMLLGALAGFAGWQLLSSGLSILSGNPMAAVPGASLVGTTETPEELQAIYSGEKEVPIRKGRFWEFGKCLAKHTEIITFSGVSKKAEDIEIGDVLVGRDHKEATVKNIFTRHHKGEILRFSCAFDRDLKVEVTGNHKIPILRKLGLDKEHRVKYKTEEVEASEIRLNDYVEIPVKKLESDITEINSLDYLEGPVFVQDKKIYSSQLNWFSRKPQRSGSHSIPTSIPLNEDIGFLFGIYLAEGNIGQKDNTPHLIEMVHSVHEKWIVEKIQLITEQYFNSKTTVRFKKTGKKTKEGCYITRVCSSILAKLFRGLFYPKDYNAEEKSIPNIFMYGHKSFKEGLIEGYYTGDGHWDSAKVISSSRKWLLEQIQQIALSIGRLSNIGSKEENGFLGRWKLRFVSNSATNPSVINYKGKIYAAIRTIETEEYDGAVYDFEVDDPDHLFRAGPFLVHNSSFEGDKIQYFRQHALPRLRARAYQKGLYGSEEERWEYSPWLNPVKALFGSDEWKYHYEQKYQQERPAPVTAPAGEEIPFIGPLVAETIGKLIKPRKLVRPEEWITDTGVIHKPKDEELEPAYGVGGLPAGQPLAPGESTQLFNELLYRRREAVGLVGFTEGALTKSLLGREEIFPNQQTLAQMGKETGGEHWLFQHLNLGGAIGSSEAARRFIPRTRSYLDTYNPLSNQMPSWMPGEDYFMDFKTGNPYQLSQLPEAEIRLPGPGLASLYPALEGVDPENYPLAYRAKVLGDVAFWSNEYKQTISQAKKNLKFMSEEEQQIVLTTEEQVKAKKQRRNFKDYVFAQDQLQQETVTVTGVLSPRRFKTKEYGDTILEAKGIGAITKPQEALETTINALEGSKISIYSPGLESRRFSRVSEGPRMEVVPMLGDRDLGTVLTEAGYAKHKELEDEFRQIRFTPSERLAGSISERILHNAETPLEYLTPISPASKLIRQRSPIEEYERTEAIGTANSFWDRPVDNFLKPAYNMTKYELGSSEIPEEIQQRRDITEYFDKLEWVKTSRLEAKAKLSGDFHLASEFKKQKESTVFGVDVFNSPVNVMRALPRRERDFFNEFVQAKTIEDREKILSLVPEDEKRIYLTQWARQEENSSRAKIEAKIATEDDNKALSLVAQMRKSEGFSFDEAMARRWMEETGGKIAFDDWLREQEAEEYFRTHSLPGADWIGFNPAVSLDDIRMVAVEMLGQDFHEHDLWDDRKRLLARKPYINPTVVSEMQEQAEYQDSWKVARNSKALTEMFGDYKASLYQSKVAANLGPPRYNIELRDGRQDLIDKAYERITG